MGESKLSADAEAVIHAINSFAFRLFQQRQESAKSRCISPTSIVTALAMALAGARNETAAQMRQILSLPELSEARLIAAVGALQDSMIESAERCGLTYRVANSLWGQTGDAPRESYLRLVRDILGSKYELVDYQEAAVEAAGVINRWTSEQTRGRIPEIIDPEMLSPLTRLVLVNALYFKGAWMVPFDPGCSQEGDFFPAVGTEAVPVTYMQDTREVLYGEGTSMQIIELVYGVRKPQAVSGDDLRTPSEERSDGVLDGGELMVSEAPPSPSDHAMLFLLPRDLAQLADLEAALSEEAVADWRRSLVNREVQIFLPRFKTEESMELSDLLIEMGMALPFDDVQADFSGITGTLDPDRSLSISKVIHKTRVEVNEEGAEAAAATAILMALGCAPDSAPPPPPPVFRADHPFLYMIIQRSSGQVIFLGRMNDPSR
ncbi:MAG: serpin family protein [Magnetococcales bacterium]|nr:serpin family protein [Magnetococcales bacterium]